MLQRRRLIHAPIIIFPPTADCVKPVAKATDERIAFDRKRMSSAQRTSVVDLRYLRLRLELEPERVKDPENSVEFGPRLSAHLLPFLLRHGVPYHVKLTHKKLITRRPFKPRGDRCDEH
jgi:hypothetical protein